MGGEARDGLAPPAVSHFGLCRAGLAALRLPCLAGTIPTAHEPVLKLESPAPRARNVIAQGNALGELCTKSLFVSPPQRTNDNSPAVHCWEHEQETHVSPGSGRLKRSPLDALFFNRPLHGLGLTFRCYPSDKSLGDLVKSLLRTRNRPGARANTAASCKNLRAHRETLAAQVQTLRARCEILRAQVQTLRAQCETLAAQVQTLRAQCETLAAQVQTLRAQCEILAAQSANSGAP